VISRRKIKIGIGILVGLPTVVILSWVVTDSVLHATSDEDFCGGCHTMSPVVMAYREDVHGGAGTTAVQAKCINCHVPHDNPVNYMWMKARFGMHDAWAQLTYDLDAIDWQEKRKKREEFVFDSGCLTCHSNLERASEKSPKSFVAHKPYFLETTKKKCVTCHQSVGHRDLARHRAATNQAEVDP